MLRPSKSRMIGMESLLARLGDVYTEEDVRQVIGDRDVIFVSEFEDVREQVYNVAYKRLDKHWKPSGENVTEEELYEQV